MLGEPARRGPWHREKQAWVLLSSSLTTTEEKPWRFHRPLRSASSGTRCSSRPVMCDDAWGCMHGGTHLFPHPGWVRALGGWRRAPLEAPRRGAYPPRFFVYVCLFRYHKGQRSRFGNKWLVYVASMYLVALPSWSQHFPLSPALYPAWLLLTSAGTFSKSPKSICQQQLTPPARDPSFCHRGLLTHSCFQSLALSP